MQYVIFIVFQYHMIFCLIKPKLSEKILIESFNWNFLNPVAHRIAVSN